MFVSLLAVTLPLLSPAVQEEPATAELAEKIAGHAFLGRSKYEVDTERVPFVVWIEKPRGEAPGHVETVGRVHAKALGAMGAAIDRVLVEPAKLKLAEGRDGLQNVFVFSSQAAYVNGARYGDPKGRNAPFATTIPDLDLVVGYLDPELGEEEGALFALLQESAMRLLEDRIGGSKALKDRWLLEGLASYFANAASRGMSDASLVPPGEQALHLIRELSSDPETQEARLLPVDKLLEAVDERILLYIYRTRASESLTRPPNVLEVHEAYRAQSAMFVHFLMHGQGSRYRDGLRKYATRAFAGEGSPDALKSALGIDDLNALDKQFQEFLDLVAGGGSSDSLSTSMARALEATATNHPSVLPQPASPGEWLAYALGRARQGALGSALNALEAGIGSAAGDELARLEREKARLTALRDARDAYLASLVGTKTRLRLELEGEKLTSVVTGIAEGTIQFGKNKYGVETLPVDALRPGDIASNLGRKAAEFGAAWIPSYAQLLEGEKRWDKDLDAESEDGKALAADGASGYEESFTVGDGMAALAALALAPHPTDSENARLLTDAIRTLLSEHGELDAVQVKREALRGLAAAAYSKIYEDEGVAGVLNGETEDLGDGRIRVKYDFKQRSHAKDFRRRANYLADKRSFENNKGEEDSSFKIAKGALVADGFACYEHVLGFEAPMTVKYEIRYGKAKKGSNARTSFIVGICDDERASYVIAYDMHDLETVDKQRKFVRTEFKEGDRPIDVKKPHKLELDHDGETTVTFSHNGKELRSIECGPRRAGAVFLWSNTEVPISIQSLEIEGKVMDSVVDRLRDEWVAEQTSEMGL